MKSLREEQGLTYGVFSNLWVGKQPGYFFAATQTGIATMNQALSSMLTEIERFLDEGVTEEELVWAKKFLTGSLPLTLETNEQLAHKLLEQEFFGLCDHFWLEDLKRMQAVTVGEVRDVARRHIHPDRFAVVVLGDFREQELEVGAGGG
jgi:zinc protease